MEELIKILFFALSGQSTEYQDGLVKLDVQPSSVSAGRHFAYVWLVADSSITDAVDGETPSEALSKLFAKVTRDAAAMLYDASKNAGPSAAAVARLASALKKADKLAIFSLERRPMRPWQSHFLGSSRGCAWHYKEICPNNKRPATGAGRVVRGEVAVGWR